MGEIHDIPDNNPIPWRSGGLSVAGAADHQRMVYAIQLPIAGKLFFPASRRHWQDAQTIVLRQMNKLAKYELQNIDDAFVRAALCWILIKSV